MTAKTASTKGATTTSPEAAEKPSWVIRTGAAIGGWFGRNQGKFKKAAWMAAGAGLAIGAKMGKEYMDSRKADQKLLTVN